MPVVEVNSTKELKMVDTLLLRKRVKDAGLKYRHIATELALTPFGLQKKIDGKNDFRASEITRLSRILSLSCIDRERIFFANEVECNSING